MGKGACLGPYALESPALGFLKGRWPGVQGARGPAHPQLLPFLLLHAPTIRTQKLFCQMAHVQAHAGLFPGLWSVGEGCTLGLGCPHLSTRVLRWEKNEGGLRPHTSDPARPSAQGCGIITCL